MQSIHQSPDGRLTFDAVKQQARGRWRHILVAAGVPSERLNKKHGPCPACGGSDRYRFDDKDGSGSFYCNGCGAGDGFRLVQLVRRCSPRESLHLVADWLNTRSVAASVPEPESSPKAAPTDRSWARRLLSRAWAESFPVRQGDPVWIYLTQTRGLVLRTVPEALRYHTGIEYLDDDKNLIGRFPAMLAAVTAPDGSMMNIHRTYLTPEGTKAPVEKPKKLMPPITERGTNGCSVRLFEAQTILGVAEGIETALACQQSTEIPVWATMNAACMSALVLPSSVSEVIIFADHDDVQSLEKGQKAAMKLSQRLLNEGRKVKILLPQTPGTDWCDVVTRRGGLSNGTVK